MADEEKSTDELLTVRLSGGQLAVSLRIYTRLFAYCAYRPRTQELLSSLRSRCIQYGKEMDASPEYVALVTPGTISLAMQVLPFERSAWATLGGVQGHVGRELSKQYTTGTVPWTHKASGTPLRGFWDRLKYIDTLLVGGRMAAGFQLPRDK